MKKRKPKSSDQEKVEKAYQILIETIQDNQKEIEPTLWIGAMIAALADNYEKSEIPFKFFKEEMNKCIDHYEY